MLETWYFYWHNKLTNEKGRYTTFMSFYFLKEELYDAAEKEKDLHWVVGEEGEYDEHPCNKTCQCKPHTEVFS